MLVLDTICVSTTVRSQNRNSTKLTQHGLMRCYAQQDCANPTAIASSLTHTGTLVHYRTRADVARWWSSSSKRVGGVTNVADGFDSHALSILSFLVRLRFGFI
jgi:hypothetical protein